MTQKKALVTVGNTNHLSFRGILYAIKKTLGNFDIIHILDSQNSAKESSYISDSKKIKLDSQDLDKENNLISRNELIRQYFPDVEIRSSIINDESPQSQIPQKMIPLIKEFGVKNVYVDLSNGKKIDTSILYSVVTISRIPNIYYLDLKFRPDENTDITLNEFADKWEYKPIEPLKEIENISKISQIELIYYADNIRSVIDSIQLTNCQLAIEIQPTLESSLIDYFTACSGIETESEYLRRSINGLGQICEKVCKIFFDKLVDSGYIQINNIVDNHRDRLNKIRGLFSQARSPKNKNKDSLIPSLIRERTYTVDVCLETMVEYRNFTSHPDCPYSFEQSDARLALDLTLLILEKVATVLGDDTVLE